MTGYGHFDHSVQYTILSPLQWHQNEHDGASNHQRLDCLLSRMFRCRSKKTSVSLAFVRGIHRWPVNSPHKGPVTRKMFPLDGVIMTYFTKSMNKCVLYWAPITVEEIINRLWNWQWVYFLLTNLFLSCSVDMLSKVSQSVNTFLIEVTVHTYIAPNAYSVMIVNVLCLRLLLIVHNSNNSVTIESCILKCNFRWILYDTLKNEIWVKIWIPFSRWYSQNFAAIIIKTEKFLKPS